MTALVDSPEYVPMTPATGTAAKVRRPLAMVVIGALMNSTVPTLLVLPAPTARLGGRREARVAAPA